MDAYALYDRLPPRLQDAAASVRGRQLARTRYGPETQRLVEEAHAREAWTADEWETWRCARLELVLHRARTQVPWYRDHWDRRQRAGDRASSTDLANWPILAKAEVRANPSAFVADDRPIRQLVADHTSGTTGTPLTLFFDRDGVRAWYALFEARIRNWHGVDRTDEVGMLGGQMVVPASRAKPPYWVVNRAMHQLYLSTHHLRTDRAAAYATALRTHDTRYLLGYTSALVTLARAGADAGVSFAPVRVSITNAEPCADADRAVIEAAFGAPVRVTYGMAEVVAAAVECPHGTLHDFPEVGWLELDPASQPVAGEPDGTGDVLATGLVNDAMPLIRYQVGDRLTLPAPHSCPCGRRLPALASVTGRTDDLLLAPDGRRIGRLDHVFKAELPVLEAQIVQETLHHIRVLVVPAPGWGPEVAAEIADRTRTRIGDVEVTVETVASIPRSATGKFRAVISHLPT